MLYVVVYFFTGKQCKCRKREDRDRETWERETTASVRLSCNISNLFVFLFYFALHIQFHMPGSRWIFYLQKLLGRMKRVRMFSSSWRRLCVLFFYYFIILVEYHLMYLTIIHVKSPQKGKTAKRELLLKDKQIKALESKVKKTYCDTHYCSLYSLNTFLNFFFFFQLTCTKSKIETKTKAHEDCLKEVDHLLWYYLSDNVERSLFWKSTWNRILEMSAKVHLICDKLLHCS